MPTAVALRPRSFTELFDAAFLLAREQFRPLATVSAIVAIPSVVLGAVNAALFGPTAASARSMEGFVQTLPLTLVSTCWYFVGGGALVRAASDAYLGERVDLAACLRHALRRAAPLIAVHLVAYCAAAIAFVGTSLGGFLAGSLAAAGLARVGVRIAPTPAVSAMLFLGLMVAAVLAGAAVLARFVSMTPVLMLEGRGAVAGLRRARELAAGHIPRIVALFAVLTAVSLAFTLTALGLSHLLRLAHLSNVLATVLAVPLYPVAACVGVALYYDLRIRKEGFDIAWAARALERGEPHAAA